MTINRDRDKFKSCVSKKQISLWNIFDDTEKMLTILPLPHIFPSLSPLQALQVALAEHQGEVDYLTSAVEQVFLKAPPDISQK